jgi:hypothetical protein
LNQPRKIKSRSDLASEKIVIDLDINEDTVGDICTIDLTNQLLLKTLSSQDLNIPESDTSIQNKRQKQKQIILSKFLINQKLSYLSDIKIT